MPKRDLAAILIVVVVLAAAATYLLGPQISLILTTYSPAI